MPREGGEITGQTPIWSNQTSGNMSGILAADAPECKLKIFDKYSVYERLAGGEGEKRENSDTKAAQALPSLRYLRIRLR